MFCVMIPPRKMKIELFVAVKYQNRKFVLSIFYNVLDYFWTGVLFCTSLIVKRNLIILIIIIIIIITIIDICTCVSYVYKPVV